MAIDEGATMAMRSVPAPVSLSCRPKFVVISPVVVSEEPVAAPMLGVIRVGVFARTTAPEPVVEAADIAVPFPERIPVIVVEIVMAGVVVAVATEPANPLAVTTETEVTVPVPEAVSVKSL